MECEGRMRRAGRHYQGEGAQYARREEKKYGEDSGSVVHAP